MEERAIPAFELTRNYQRIRNEVREGIERVLESQHFILGKEVQDFEQEVSSYLEVPFAVGCASGSDALLLALMGLGIGEGDEVITTPFTFFASASCIVRSGAKPVFVDIDPETYNMDSRQILEALTPRTKAVIAVHLFGQMCELEEIAPLLRERGIALVEDCAQSFGAWREIEGVPRRGGSIGDLGCFSFFPTKNLGCYGDGGMVTTNSPELAEEIRLLRVHGAGQTYFHDKVGLNSRLDALQAAILRARLPHVEEWNLERRTVADRYEELFAQANLGDVIHIPKEARGNYHVYHQYVVRARKRDELQEFLKERGVGSRVYYPRSLHRQRCFEEYLSSGVLCPESEKLCEECLALPMFPELTSQEQERVVESIRKFYRG
jgi:dTDP-4-amino-4,6-dideoxygalactose transaminase